MDSSRIELEERSPAALQAREEAVEVQGADGTESNVRLVREAIDEARDLVRLEVALAREELSEEMGRARGGMIAFGSAAVLAMAGFTMLIATIAFAAGRSWLCALLIGAGLIVLAAGLGLLGWWIVPHSPMSATRARLESGLNDIKERIA
jgi:hypothetical protein